MKTYSIIANGAVVGTQTVADSIAPVLLSGQTAQPQTVGFARAYGAFSATGVGASVVMKGDFNVSLSGAFVATVQLERSFDGGTTWLPLTFVDGSPVSWIAATSNGWVEPEPGVLYRLNCTSYTSGAVAWRISQ